MTTKKQSFLDIQAYIQLVNGYAGVGFNQNTVSCEKIELACKKLAEDHIEGILATIITAGLEDMIHRIQQIVRLREQSALIKKMIRGIHIEGPFISTLTGYYGAHPVKEILEPDTDTIKRLLDAGNGLVRIVTLAPERDKQNKVTKFLSEQNITVSAGHCDSSLEELKSAIDGGLRMFTHLGNGCPQNLPRHDNIIERVLLLKDDLTLCFFTDDIHILCT